MKKVTVILLVLALLTGCAPATPADTQPEQSETPVQIRECGIQVGFGRTDVTPQEPVPLGSYGNAQDRIMDTVADPLYAIAIAITDEAEETMLFVTTDLSWGNGSMNSRIRSAVLEKYGIDGECVIVGGTHNHNAPEYSLSQDERIVRYMAYWEEGVMRAIDQALNDRSPATVEICRTETVNLTFVRRYFRADGTLDDGFNISSEAPLESHESQADEEVQLVRFVREDAKDILMVNWQTHAAKIGNTKTLGTDFVGPMRDRVSEELDVHCVYYQGAAGNLNPVSRLVDECPTGDTGLANAKKHGLALAAYVIDACTGGKTFTPVRTGYIQHQQVQFKAQVNKTENNKLEDAKKVKAFYNRTGNKQETAEYAAQFDIKNIHHANAIIDKYGQEDFKTMEMNMVSVGMLSFVTLPVEFFCQSGQQIKTGTPFDMTVLMGYTCGIGRYVPTRESFENGGYEAYNSWFMPGTAEKAVSKYLEILGQLFDQQKQE